MNRIRNTVSLSLVVMSMLFGIAGLADAQRRNDRDIRDSLRSLNSKIDDFEQTVRYQMQSSSSNNGDIAAISDIIRTLRDSVREFQDNYDRRRENRDDVNKIVDAARRVNEAFQANPQNRRVEDVWTGVRRQIDRLGANYGITPNWKAEEDAQWVKDYPDTIQLNTQSTGQNSQSVGLSGTYDLDAARSENIEDLITNTSLGTVQREDLKDKLTAPQQIALDIRGNQVTLATSNASPITITADGRDKTEQSPSGKSVRVRATLTGQNLVVSSLGGETDYTITFTSLSNGRDMKVTRRITTDYLNQTVIAESVYNKTDSVAQLGIHPGVNNNNTYPNDNNPYPNNNNTYPNNSNTDPNRGYSDNDQSGIIPNGGASGGRRPATVTSRQGNFVVPNGVVLSGILESEINTKVSQNNDRFRMTVQSPDEFRGATVEGYISNINRSGKVTGRSNVTLNFERITLKNGQTYDFAGNLQSVVDTTGKNILIDNEGTIRGENQSRQTAKRGAVGGGIGLVIGAIAGGAKGAAIGAIIGAGGGAGSVAIQGESDIQLRQGTSITVQSSSPTQYGPR